MSVAMPIVIISPPSMQLMHGNPEIEFNDKASTTAMKSPVTDPDETVCSEFESSFLPYDEPLIETTCRDAQTLPTSPSLAHIYPEQNLERYLRQLWALGETREQFSAGMKRRFQLSLNVT